MKITDFNKHDYTVYTINTEGFEYKNLASVEDVVVRGFFINTKTAYGEQPVMITDNCYVNLPKHLLDDIKHIIKDDEIGREIRDLLAEAARRGVKIRVLYDAVGSWSLKVKYFKPLFDLGVECHAFMPVALPIFRRQMNYRNHRKIVVIDDRVAFTGGLNVGDEYLGKGHLGYWRDTHVKVEGEAVEALHQIFLHDWCSRTGENPQNICDNLPCDDC